MILGNIREAMDSESILLINENALSESKVPPYAASADLLMMAIFSSLDRTEKQFKELLTKAGFELVGVWRQQNMTPGSDTLFEAVLKKI